MLKFNLEKGFTNECQSDYITIGAIWDTDGRFRWLAKVVKNRGIGLLHIPSQLFRPVFDYYFTRMGYKTDDLQGEYSLDALFADQFSYSRNDYLKYCHQVSKILVRVFKINVLLAPKLADDWIISVLEGFKKSNAIVVVNDREHFISNKRMDVWPSHFEAVKQNFHYDMIFATNKAQLDFFEKCKLPPEKCILIGNPGTDYWFYKQKDSSNQKKFPNVSEKNIKLLFFSFGRRNYLNNYYTGEVRDWLSLANDYHDILLELLSKYKNLQIIYKTGGKPARDYFPGFPEFSRRAKLISGNDNSLVELDGTHSTQDLLRMSDFVLGFHTFGLVEAMFTSQPIFYGAWGELFSDIGDTLTPLHKSKGLQFFSSKAALLKACENFLLTSDDWRLSPTEIEARKHTREHYLNNPNGKVAERMVDWIESKFTPSI